MAGRKLFLLESKCVRGRIKKSSCKLRSKAAASNMTFLLYGGDGWIGSMLASILAEGGKTVIKSKNRLEDRNKIERLDSWFSCLCYSSSRSELDDVRPAFVLNCAGKVSLRDLAIVLKCILKTGTPNVDWCEVHRVETIR